MSTVLVSGASSGIGRATVERLDEAGWDVWAGVRTVADGRELERGRSGVRAVKLDVTKQPTLEAARESIGEAGALDAVVNNAGIGIAGPLELLTDDELRRQLDVNFVGQLALTRAMLPLLRLSESARVIFVSSIGGRVAFPMGGAYHASKYALEAAGDALRVELAPEGIDVVLVEPGPLSTEIWEKAQSHIDTLFARDTEGRYHDRLESFRESLAKADEGGGDADAAAKAIQSALESSSPPRRQLVGARAKVLGPLRPLIPDSVFDRIAGKAAS